ncbi:MAG: LuxR C-terminal-related transcriptional regulator [Caulobacter sp.]|nr:LuxR C-terminal-related transcriptional regulator [Caulobacter sp.]
MRRERLERRIDQASTLVLSAPAGFGKTTLLGQWRARLEAHGQRVVVIDLERSADDLPELLRSTHDADAIFIDNLDALSEPRLLKAFVRDLDPHLRLALAGRGRPRLGIARERLDEGLLRLDELDLAFDLDEIDLLLAEADPAGARDLAEPLLRATQGWPAAVSSAAAVMTAGGAGAARLSARLPRPWRAFQAFLEDRLLAPLEPEIAGLVLELGALGRFSSAFAQSVRGDPATGAQLRKLTDLGLPIARDPDDESLCVVHPLFADFLAERLAADAPGRLRDLHRAAAHWHADHDSLSEAVRSAFASNDAAFAAELLARASAERRRVGRFRTFASWTSRLPEELFDRYPTLRIEAACAHAALFEQEAARLYAAPVRLRYDELSPIARDDLHAVDAVIALYADRPEASLDAGLRGLRACTGFDPYTLGTLRLSSAYGYMCKGAHEAARQALVRARADHEQARSHFGIACALALTGLSHAMQGRLPAAVADWREADRAISALPDGEILESVAIGYLPETLYEWNDIAGAETILRRCLSRSMEVALPDMVAGLFVAAARVAAVRGEADKVTEVLDAAEVAALRRSWPRLAHIVAWERVRMAVLAGDLVEARRLQATALAEQDFREPEGYLPHAAEMEAEQIGALRLEIAAGPSRATLTRLRAAIGQANSQARVWRLVRLLVLEAKAHAALDSRPAALRSLRRALELSAPGRMIRSYADEGAVILDLLAELLKEERRAPMALPPAYVEDILRAGGRDPAAAAVALRPVETLSRRELDVLAMLAAGLSNAEIGARLFVSQHTVKWHLQHVYEKLGVKSRTGAVLAARERRLLPET